jgi:hypothetical protein
MDILLIPIKYTRVRQFLVLKQTQTKRCSKDNNMLFKPLDQQGKDMWGKIPIAHTTWKIFICQQMSRYLLDQKLSTTLSPRR